MAQMSTTSVDLATSSGTLLTGSIASTAAGDGAVFGGWFNVTLTGTWVGTVVLQRSFDGGATYVTASTDGAGTAASYTGNISVVVAEPEAGVWYRVSFTRTSGTVVYRLSQTTRTIMGVGQGSILT